MITFNTRIKELRIEKRLTLRNFCSQIGLDPSNWSKVERGINSPPGDLGTLEKIAQFLALSRDEKVELFDLAATTRWELPADLAEDKILLKALPAFFRAARGHELTPDKIQEFIQDLLKLHKKDKR